MKILHTIPTFAPALRWGGPTLALVDLTQEQARQGHEVTVLTTDLDVDGRLNVPVRRPVSMPGVEVWYCPVSSLALARRFDFSPDASRFLRSRVHSFDIVHAHGVFSWTPTISALWSRWREVPYFVRPAGSLSTTCLTKPYEKLFNSFCSRIKKQIYLFSLGHMVLERASALHFCTEQEREEARPLGLHPPTVVVPLGVSAAPANGKKTAAGLRERYPSLRNKTVVLYLSRLDRIKGLDLLVRALGSLARAGYEFGFAIAGDGPEGYRREILSLISAQGIALSTVFLGSVFGDEKAAVLNEADLFALTSHHENLGIAVLEAMSAGLPVVISRNVAIHREVTHWRAGIATGVTPDEIASALRPLLASGALRTEMGSRGRKLVSECFAWPRIVEKLTGAYEQVIQKRPSETAFQGPRN